MQLLTKSLLTAALGLSPLAAMADDNITSVVTEFSTTELSATSTVTVSFTTASLLTAGENLTIALTDGSALSTALGFTDVTVSGGTIDSYLGGAMAFDNYTPEAPGAVPVDGVSAQLATDLPAGTYTVVLNGVVNPSESTALAFGMVTFESVTFSDYTVGELVNLPSIELEAAAFDATALTGLKTKNLTTNSGTLKWGAYAGEGDVTYTVVLFKKNGDKVKAFKNVTALKQDIAKSTKYLKAGKNYKFRVKACDAADATTCTDWSAYKSFVMLAE